MAPGGHGPAMTRAEDVSGALRAVWEVRRAEEANAYCLGAWHNIIFGAMGAVIFAAYALAPMLGAPEVVYAWLWLPPLLAAYTALAFTTKSVLRLPRPALPWGEVAIGTGLFVALMGVLALAVVNGVLTDIAAGMSMVIGAFYVILGLVFLHRRVPALFGLAAAAGAAAIAVLGLPSPASTAYGIVAVCGGMVAMGAWMLRHPEHGAPPTRGDVDPRGSELQEVRETLAGLRGHEAAVQARERAAKTFLAAAVMALAGVAGLLSGAHPYPWALLALAGLTAAVGLVRQRAAAPEAGHGA